MNIAKKGFIQKILTHEEIEWMDFANSMHRQFQSKGNLSDGQLAYIIGKNNPKGKMTFESRIRAKDPEFPPSPFGDLAKEKGKAIESSKAVDVDYDLDIPAPEGLEYMPFQRAGIAYAMARENTLIGDEMGLGKTIQALGVINADPTIRDVLIICPASLKINWQREAQKWLVRPMTVGIVSTKEPFPDTDIKIINYDILTKFKSQLRAINWDFLVVDEVHYLKNPKALRTAQVFGKWNKDPSKKIHPLDAKRRAFMTGTPIVNRPIELFPLLKFTGIFKNWKHFVERYCNGHQTRWGWDVSGASNLGELQGKLRSTIMVRRLKKDVLTDLPPKRRQVIELPQNGCVDAIRAEREY